MICFRGANFLLKLQFLWITLLRILISSGTNKGLNKQYKLSNLRISQKTLGKLPDFPENTPLPLVTHHLQSPRPQSPPTPSPSTPVSLGNINYIAVRKQIKSNKNRNTNEKQRNILNKLNIHFQTFSRTYTSSFLLCHNDREFSPSQRLDGI